MFDGKYKFPSYNILHIHLIFKVDILQHTYVFKAGWWELGQKKHHKTPITLHLHRHEMLTEASEGRVCEDWMLSKRSAVFYRDVMVSPLWEEFWVIEVKVDTEAMQQTHILLIKSYVKPNHVFGALCGERTIMIFFQENMLDSQEMEIWHCLYFKALKLVCLYCVNNV